jgi:hypothetical protein
MFGIAIGLVLMAAGQASAAPSGQVQPVGFSPFVKDVRGHVGAQARHEAATGLIVVQNSDGTKAYAYCIDVSVTILLNKNFTPQPWDSTHTRVSPENLSRINWILHQYPASATVTKGTANGATEAAGVQAAIWFFSDNFTFNSTDRSAGQNDPAVISLYDQIVAAAQSHSTPQPAPTLSISPATGSATAGSNTGPYTVASTASGPVALAVSPAGSATIVDCTSHAAVSSVTNGGTFCLNRGTAGSTTVTGTATEPIQTGTVLVDLAETNQRLIMATDIPAQVTASAAGTWTAAQPTPPTVTMACPTGGFTAGQPATFTATPSGSPGPFTFEWKKNGTVIAGETGSSVTVTLASTDTLTVTAKDTSTGLTSAAATAACTGTTSHPAITITKVANPTNVFGPANVTFTYVITNAGNVPLKLASLVDDHGTPGNAADDLPIADFKNCNTSAVMLPGAAITCTISYVLPQVTSVTSQTNTVVVTGTPVTPSGTPTGQPPVSDTAQAKVTNNPATQVLAQTVPNTPETPAAQASPTTTAAPSSLPRTGTGATIPLVLTGLFLLLAGAVVETARRRKKHPTT